MTKIVANGNLVTCCKFVGYKRQDFFQWMKPEMKKKTFPWHIVCFGFPKARNLPQENSKEDGLDPTESNIVFATILYF